MAKSVKIEGLVRGRSGDTMILQTSDSPKIVLLLTDSTQVSQVQGKFKARRKQMSMAAFVPGLAMQVEGSSNAENELVATSIKFKGNDLRGVQSIQAGGHETKVQAQQNTEELEKQNALLKEQNEALKQQQAQLTEQQAKIATNTAAIDAGESRQVGSDKSAEHEQEKRCIVVRLLQNEGIAGI